MLRALVGGKQLGVKIYIDITQTWQSFPNGVAALGALKLLLEGKPICGPRTRPQGVSMLKCISGRITARIVCDLRW
jgi:hypothetical protein